MTSVLDAFYFNKSYIYEVLFLTYRNQRIVHVSIFCRGKDEQMNHGGYSSHIVCKDHFAVKIAREMHEAATAPLLCAGITIYEPMKVFYSYCSFYVFCEQL